MSPKLISHILLWAALTSTVFAADWRDYSVGTIGTLQYDADSYRKDPGSRHATIDTRSIPSQPGHLNDGRAYSRIEGRTTIDCDRRELNTVEQRYVDANQQVLRNVASPTPPSPIFAKPDAGNWVRFVISVCQLELRGVGAESTQRRWVHYLENERGALYFDSAGIKAIAPYEDAHVRLYYLGGAQMPNGEKVDLSEADWLIDCRNKQGAVAEEKKIRVEAGQGKVVASMKADVKNMPFALPEPGTLSALFTDSLCSGELSRSR
ncbi:MAG: hypothetical protein JF606_25115 [Burkholderiales bacterium]|jgi:hypothetical protein|nr:hypothetical protein [Burkholderiales bacterium]